MIGIIPPLVTPLLDPDTLDLDGLARLIEHVVNAGVNGIFLLGSTGEGPSLSYALRAQLVRESSHLVGGRVPVLVGVTDTSYTESVHLAGIAAEAGASFVVASAPYYFRCTQADLRRWVERLADECPLPLFLYNIPGLTKVDFAVETVRALADNPRIAGLKDSSGDMEYLRAAVEATRGRDDFKVLIGPEEMLVDAMRFGCDGGVCGGANLHPRLFVKMYEAAKRGDWQEADRLQAESRAMSAALYTVGDPATSYFRGIKAALAAAGLCRSTMALPFLEMDSEEQSVIREYVEKLRIA